VSDTHSSKACVTVESAFDVGYTVKLWPASSLQTANDLCTQTNANVKGLLLTDTYELQLFTVAHYSRHFTDVREEGSV